MTRWYWIKTVFSVIATILGLKNGLRVSSSFVPKSIRTKLNSGFKPESPPLWNVRPMVFEAVLIGNGRFRFVSFSIWGNQKSVITEIELENLPLVIKENLMKNFGGSTFKKVYKVKERQNQYFEIELKKGLLIKNLKFTPNGKLKCSNKQNILN